MQKQPDGRNELRTVDDVLMIYPVLNVRNDRTRVDRETGSCPAMRRTVRWVGVEPLGERLGGGVVVVVEMHARDDESDGCWGGGTDGKL